MCSRFANACLGLRVALNHVGSFRVRWGPAPALIVVRLLSLVSALARRAMDDDADRSSRLFGQQYERASTPWWSTCGKPKPRCYDQGLVSDSLSSHVVPFKT